MSENVVRKAGKLGRHHVETDSRTINYKKVRLPFTVVAAPPIPYDVQTALSITDTQEFLNDQLGDCVLAAAYHILEVFSKQETGVVVIPTNTEVKTTYFTLTGGQDTGLVILTFLQYWQKTGIPAQGKLYKIYAFVSVDQTNQAEICDAIYYLKNVFCGLNLPLSAQTQYEAGQPWTVTTGPDAEPGSWGGHGVDGEGYVSIASVNEIGPVIETWGTKQQCTWQWFYTYCDELYCVVPAQNVAGSSIDPVALDHELTQITSDPTPPNPSPAPTPTPIPPAPSGGCKIFGMKLQLRKQKGLNQK